MLQACSMILSDPKNLRLLSSISTGKPSSLILNNGWPDFLPDTTSVVAVAPALRRRTLPDFFPGRKFRRPDFVPGEIALMQTEQLQLGQLDEF